MPMSPSLVDDPASTQEQPGNTDAGWPLLPIETDIYILADGRVVVADMPAELAAALLRLGRVEPCEISDHDLSDPVA